MGCAQSVCNKMLDYGDEPDADYTIKKTFGHSQMVVCNYLPGYVSHHQYTNWQSVAKVCASNSGLFPRYWIPWNLTVLNTVTKICSKLIKIIVQTLFFHFDEMETIPWKFRTDGYSLNFDAWALIYFISRGFIFPDEIWNVHSIRMKGKCGSSIEDYPHLWFSLPQSSLVY